MDLRDMKNKDELRKSAMYPNCCSVEPQEWTKGRLCTDLTVRFCRLLLMDGCIKFELAFSFIMHQFTWVKYSGFVQHTRFLFP
jgi:hypothetical protein